MAVIGLGTIGLELGQSLARLGIEVTGFDQLETIGVIHELRRQRDVQLAARQRDVPDRDRAREGGIEIRDVAVYAKGVPGPALIRARRARRPWTRLRSA